MWTEDQINTPCTRYGSQLCSGCRQRLNEMRAVRCYRSGRAVNRLRRLRAAQKSGPSQPLSIFARLQRHYTKDQSLVGMLKRIYGAQYEGQYTYLCLAKEIERFEGHRFMVRGTPRRTWAEINESFRTRRGLPILRLGKDPIHELAYRPNPFFALFPKAMLWANEARP
jgi:hypothetical protein